MPDTSRTIGLADRIDRLNGAIGRTVAWACLFVVVVQFTVVVLRYGFGIGSIWLSESIVYAHAGLFMLAAAWALPSGWVRSDSRSWDERSRICRWRSAMVSSVVP